MKLKFKNQDFQTDAVNAVVDLFTGQEKNQATFSPVQFALAQGANPTLFNDFGVGNAMFIGEKQLTANMQEVQRRGRLPFTDLGITNSERGMNGNNSEFRTPNFEFPQFSVEMETGTGKTYVYTKTIFELNRRYGFTKFIIVVPSVAIREGVYKSFQITAEHFGSHYDNAPNRYFIYDSAKLSDVRQFASSSNIEIMIINIDAFKKAENIINQVQDKLNGETAMRYIQDTNPIVIIDEPQSVDNTPKAKEAIASLKPMCVLRYSATHRERINLLYRLTPVDAYQMGLVKQICVSSNRAENDFNKPYIRLVSVSHASGFTAKLEIDAENADKKVTRKTITVKPGADLYLLSGERELYDGYVVDGIDCSPNGECVEFANTEIVRLGKAIGSVDETLIKRAQIRRTIEAHLDKELRYRHQGIKVLSLFFIDEVAKYRTIDGDKGIYAQMFEECYNELIARPKYAELQGLVSGDVSKAHDGYFSQDKKGIYKNTRGDTAADYDTYNTIMKDKEWLLSFDCPLRFIFSHSALKEGWDNPNVFQVCTLIEQKSTFTCRQKVGRGLRLCVNQEGDRIEDRNINVLHVMANESFAEFAGTLQKEIEQETGVKFGVLQLSMLIGTSYEETKTVEKTLPMESAANLAGQLQNKGYLSPQGQILKSLQTAIAVHDVEFAEELTPAIHEIIAKAEEEKTVNAQTLSAISYTETVVEEKTISYEEAAEVMKTLEKDNFITKDGKIKDTLKAQFQAGTLDLGARFSQAAQRAIVQQIEKADTRPPIRDASRDVVVRLNKQVMLSPEFQELWGKIKQKTTYRVRIDTDELIKRASKALSKIDSLVGARIVSETGEVNIDNPGVEITGLGTRIENIDNSYTVLPDILNAIGEATRAKRSTVYEIINQSGRLEDFICNPQIFIEQATEIIKNERHKQAIDGIRYVKLDGQEYYAQEIFDTKELLANLDRNAVAVNNSIYDYIVYDSGGTEKPFALALDKDPDVKMFFKLPNKFRIETPIGTYNPDWAVYLERDGEERLYFILETKGSINDLDLRGRERLKIRCGKEHFKALKNEVEMRVATNWKTAKAGM